jgi:hypothetical protein
MSPKLEQLSQKKWELAFRVVNRAWEASSNPLAATLRPPKSLQHLEQEDWEQICRCLWVLEQQRAQSVIH